jgi:hypothetical protein
MNTQKDAQSVGNQQDEGSARKLADDGLMYDCICICALFGWSGDAECEAMNGHFV